VVAEELEHHLLIFLLQQEQVELVEVEQGVLQ
jgi:hypothetical protein